MAINKRREASAGSTGNGSDWSAPHIAGAGSGSGESGSQMTTPETELRIQLSESRTETKFAELIGHIDQGFSEIRGEMRSTNARLDGVERSTAGIKATVILTGIASVALVVAILAFGQQWFGIGVSVRDIVHSAVSEYRIQSQQQPAPPPLTK
jgi:hypothetical protein